MRHFFRDTVRTCMIAGRWVCTLQLPSTLACANWLTVLQSRVYFPGFSHATTRSMLIGCAGAHRSVRPDAQRSSLYQNKRWPRPAWLWLPPSVGCHLQQYGQCSTFGQRIWTINSSVRGFFSIRINFLSYIILPLHAIVSDALYLGFVLSCLHALAYIFLYWCCQDDR